MTRRAAVTVAVLGALALIAEPASAFAPAGGAAVRPGAQTFTGGGQCTANFVFTGAGGSVYIGQAAHCSGTGGQTQTDGCTSKSLPLGTLVRIKGARKPGRLAYNSWISMQARGERDPHACAFNDFALVKLDPEDAARTNPSVPFFGGPTGLNTAGTGFGGTVLSYGNSSLRQGIALLSPKLGLSLGTRGGGWTHPVYTITPGIPGDSGSAFMDRSGRALGVLSTLALAPLVLSNGVGDLSRALAYANGTTKLGVKLARGTTPFRRPLF